MNTLKKYSLYMITASIAVLTLIVTSCGKDSNSLYENVKLTSQGTVELPVSLFENGQARHYVYEKDDSFVRFFVLKSSDGVIRTAFDACDVCWRSNKGYAQQGDYMVCQNCGMNFRSTGINVIRGGCNPSPLESNIDNGKVIIKESDLLAGKQYFDFASGDNK
jgi:uncharacterized membrane protein